MPENETPAIRTPQFIEEFSQSPDHDSQFEGPYPTLLILFFYSLFAHSFILFFLTICNNAQATEAPGGLRHRKQNPGISQFSYLCFLFFFIFISLHGVV